MSKTHMMIQLDNDDDEKLRVAIIELSVGNVVASKAFEYPKQHDAMRDYVLDAIKRYDCDNKQHMINLFDGAEDA